MDILPRCAIGMTLLAPLAGCGKKAPPPEVPPPVAGKTTGRLVPAVVASFERGAGGWKSAPVGTGTASLDPPEVTIGGAAKGDRWLSQAVQVDAGAKRTIEVYGGVPAQDWSRFGQTVRASVQAVPAGNVTARLAIVSPFGAETEGPETAIGEGWTSLAWDAGAALSQVGRVGVRYHITGPWRGRLGLDNVRIGAQDALTTAYSVVYGPYPSRGKAVEGMNSLKTSGIDSFPIYEQGWYLNLGTFSTRKSAQSETKRLGERGLKASILVR
jgi:hypothetical protein